MTRAIEQLLHDLYALCRFITLMIHKSFESFSFHSNLYFSLSLSLSLAERVNRAACISISSMLLLECNSINTFPN